MSRTVDNNGIGALYATFNIHQTNDIPDLTEEDVGKGVTLCGNNEISFSGHNYPVSHLQLLGRLEHVSGNLAVVQIRGVARFTFDPNIQLAAPKIGSSVGCSPDGSVMFCQEGKGMTFAVDYENETCDVLL